MSPNQPADPLSPPSVLQSLAKKGALPSKILLSDTASAVGASPMVTPSGSAVRWAPKGHGNYQFLGEIARGGMGVILKGHDTDLGRDIAVKVLDGQLARRPEVVQRFIEEAQIGGQLQHPGIVPVYELGLMADESPYFTMKLIKGQTLASLFAERKTVADNRARLLAILESVCQTMAYAHSKGVLHRDLKPANIMVGAFAEVQVVDWGLAKVLRRGGVADERRAEESRFTVIETVRSGPGSSGSDSIAGSVMGTPAYMAPEQAQGEIEQLDERADVFALGAILCELLTGRPPYEKTETEPVLVQAAHARLQPARTRLEECGGDPVLVRLCLSCLMPARAARPANASHVAQALHDYLASVEDRAQQAELAAEKARIQAAEERRRRRLQFALGSTITLALLLAGGGYFWVERERGKRLEQTRSTVDVAHREAIEAQRAGKPDAALLAARRGLAAAEGTDTDASLLAAARAFVAQAERDATLADRERQLLAQDQALRSRLIDLRLQQIVTIGDPARVQELDAAFTKAFADYGVDLEADNLTPALQRIHERAIAEEVALALDDWGRLRRAVHGAQSLKARGLHFLAMDLDPDSLRKRMREAVDAADTAAMWVLIAPANLPQLGPGSVFAVCAALLDSNQERSRDIERTLDLAVQQHPDDFVLQAFAGQLHQEVGNYPAALACRAAAQGLRPRDLTARLRLAETQMLLGQLLEASANLRACLRLEPNHKDANDLLGQIQCMLGNYADAVDCYTRTPLIAADPITAADLHLGEFLVGRRSRADLEKLLPDEPWIPNVAGFLFVLASHPDPAKSDPEFVLRELADRESMIGTHRWRYYVEAIARLQLGDWPAAMALLDQEHRVPLVPLMTPMSYDFLRALVCSKNGRAAEARACHARGMNEWERTTSADPAAWERSDAMRWRREAEAAMGK